MNSVRQLHNSSLARYQKEKGKLEREKAKIIQSIKDGVPGTILKDDAIRVQTRLEELEQILESTEEAPILFHPKMAERYHQQVQRLITALNEEQHRSEAGEILRGLIEKIVLVPEPGRKELAIDLQGDLAGILSLATGRGLPSSAGSPALGNSALTGSRSGPKLSEDELQQVKMVAGGHNQLPLRGGKNQQEKMVAGARNSFGSTCLQSGSRLS